MSDNSNIRKRLQEIRDDTSLTPAEKNRRSQDVMMGKSPGTEAKAELVPNTALSCNHYEKQCSKFFFECCKTIDPCHRCHMARECCEVKPHPISSIMCNACNTRQPPSSICTHCSQPFSRSHCAQCTIWTAAAIHHCPGCGFCRVGEAHQMFHCDTCEACFSTDCRDDHMCAKTAIKGELCPLCLESGE